MMYIITKIDAEIPSAISPFLLEIDCCERNLAGGKSGFCAPRIMALDQGCKTCCPEAICSPPTHVMWPVAFLSSLASFLLFCAEILQLPWIDNSPLKAQHLLLAPHPKSHGAIPVMSNVFISLLLSNSVEEQPETDGVEEREAQVHFSFF